MTVAGEMVFCFNSNQPVIPNTLSSMKRRRIKNENERIKERKKQRTETRKPAFQKFSLDKMIA